MDPVARDPDGPAGSAMNADRSELTRERSFRVRLTFVGNHVTLDPNFAPVLDPRARFHVYSRGDDAPIDTVPAYGRLVRIEWRSSAHDTDSVAVGRKAVRPGLESVWIEDETAARDTGQVFAPGFHQLVLPAPPRAGGGTVTVRFISDFVPTAWFAGPDPAQFPLLNDGGRGVTVTNWSGLVTTPLWPPDGRTYFAPDSFRFVPSRRRPVGGNFERRTFYEIFENRVYARNEGDAVHVGSWVALVNGGYDRDSPYVPLVQVGDPALPPGFPGNPSQYPVLLPQGLIGSPIGFRLRLSVRLPNGQVARFAASSTYPNFVPTSVFRLPQVSGYAFMNQPGKAYIAVRAVDSHERLGPGAFDEVGLADLVDAGGGTPEQRRDRRSILTFYVGTPPPSETLRLEATWDGEASRTGAARR